MQEKIDMIENLEEEEVSGKELYLLGVDNGRIIELDEKEQKIYKIKKNARNSGYLDDGTRVFFFDKEQKVIDNILRRVIYEDSSGSGRGWLFRAIVFFGILIFIFLIIFSFNFFNKEEKLEEVKPQKIVVESKKTPSSLEEKIEKVKIEEPTPVIIEEEVVEEVKVEVEEVKKYILENEYDKLNYLYSSLQEDLNTCGQELNNQALHIQAILTENEELKKKLISVDEYENFLGKKIFEKCENPENNKIKKTCDELASLWLKNQKIGK